MADQRGSPTAESEQGSTARVLQLVDAAETADAFEEVVRVRLDRDLLERLDRIEALVRGQGYRKVTRSSLIRAALSSFVEAVEQEGTTA